MTGLNKVIKIDVISVPFSGHLFPTLTLVKPLLEDPRFSNTCHHRLSKEKLVEKIGFDCVALFPDRPTSDGRYRQYLKASKTTYYVPTINRK